MNLSLITGNNLVDNTTAGIAASAVATPLWLPWLQTASEVAAIAAPILGGLWLAVQTISKIVEIAAKVRNK